MRGPVVLLFAIQDCDIVKLIDKSTPYTRCGYVIIGDGVDTLLLLNGLGLVTS